MANEYQDLKKKRYLEIIRECSHSGKTKRAWCKENGIGYSTYMRWEKLLRDEAAGKILNQQAIVPVTVAVPSAEKNFNEISPIQDICIQKGDLSIRLPGSLPAEYILGIVKGLT